MKIHEISIKFTFKISRRKNFFRAIHKMIRCNYLAILSYYKFTVVLFGTKINSQNIHKTAILLCCYFKSNPV